MTIKKMMMAAGAIDGPQVIAPSSNDWDYSFDDGGEWPCAGNTLGDGTSGGFVDNTGGDSCIRSLQTFDGDFYIELTGTGLNNCGFGVYDITEDDTYANGDRAGLQSMTVSYHWHDAYEGPGTSCSYGSAGVGSFTKPADGSVMAFRRVSSVITFEDDGAVLHTFSQTFSGTMRFSISAAGTPFDANIDNILYTDTEKVQRDGFFNEGAASAMSASSAFNGARIVATRSGVVTSVKFNVASVSSSYNGHCEIWVGDGTNPTAQLGSDSNTVAMSSTGDKTFTFSAGDAVIKKGQFIWAIIAQETSGSINLSCVSTFGRSRSGLGSAATSLSDEDREYKMEMVVDTSAGEPTPDHDTLLLVHSDTSDGSTTFVDSSQFGRNATANGNIQHDTAQKKFGATAMLFDGTGDYVTFPDSNDWDFSQYTSGTVEFWIRTSTSSVGVLNQATSDPINNFDIYVNGAGKIQVLAGANGSAGAFSLLSTTAITDSAWHHCAVVWSNGIGQLFVDGTSEVQNTYTNYVGAAASKNFEIGRGKSTGTGYTMNGWLDEVRVSRVARWDANFTPPSSPYP